MHPNYAIFRTETDAELIQVVHERINEAAPRRVSRRIPDGEFLDECAMAVAGAGKEGFQVEVQSEGATAFQTDFEVELPARERYVDIRIVDEAALGNAGN